MCEKKAWSIRIEPPVKCVGELKKGIPACQVELESAQDIKRE